jgi:NDP-sugar pyrophosphorylase family protein
MPMNDPSRLEPSRISIVVLAGGRGTRIAHLRPDTPKPLVAVNGRPFLDWLTLYIAAAGPRRFVVSAGYKAEQIAAWAVAAATTLLPGAAEPLTIKVVAEASPLGTGGAIINCLGHCEEWFLALNGDSIALCDIAALAAMAGTAGLDGAIVGLPAADTSRFGSLDVGADGLLKGFREKQPGAGLINAGLYLLRRSQLEPLRRPGMISVETEVLPRLLADGRRIAVLDAGAAAFIDIGTPETLAAADAFIAGHMDRFPQLG